jgi:rod shape-determining protein MreD
LIERTRNLHSGFLTALWLLPILALLQCTLVPHFGVRGVVPSIVLIAVIDWGILRGMDEGLIWAFLGGLSLDVFSGWPIGTNTVALVVVTSVVSLGEGTFMRTHSLVPIATVLGATVLYYGICLFILQSTQQSVDWPSALRSIVLPIALYNAVLNVFGFRLCEWLERRIYPLPRASW